MNSMRLLILLTFILYETQSAPSIKPLKFLKSLISKHLPSTTEQPLSEEEIYPAYKCESVEEGAIDDSVIEWNRQVFLVNEKPILIEVGNVGQIQKENHDEDLTVSPEISPEVNCEGNAEINPEVNLEVNPEGHFEENPKFSPEEEHKNAYEKDLNTQWLLGENTSEKLPEINVGTPSIKDKIINKINIIKSKLKFKNRLVIPITELVEDNKNNVEFTSVNPITTMEPITTGNPTTVQHISTIQPVTTGHQYTTTVQPFTSTHPAISAQYTTTVKPEGYVPDVQVNYGIESQEPIVTIPTQNQMPLQPQQIYYSDLYYPPWLTNCPPPLSHQICYRQNNYYAQSPKFTNTLNTNQFNLENTPYNTPEYQNQKNNNGLTKVINYIKIDATQQVNPIKPNQDQQWVHYTYENPKHINQNPISYYYNSPTANPEPQPEIIFPSSNGVDPSSTMQPIVVYTVDASALPINQLDQTQPKYNLDQLLGPAKVNSNVEGSRYPLRGDIQFGEDVNPNINYDQPEGDNSEYTLKERRNVGHYNSDSKLAKPVFERAETLTSANKIEMSTVTETKTPITKIETPIANIEKPVHKIENPDVKNETPSVTSTETPHLESNDFNTGVE
ncbi:uncharacterized protein LOC100568832 [Acyrthosiphon pisum]|uniref:Uncharacterized protein n=1 Tax=Acyrthosiphon pisum TaxID=7029 RepID=A0A8R2AC28_ACYPI|nr:uncharacterized protein LOC100568832 [Acyrthosiphon pisum]|eukprot:XP_003244647.1 PREDICTED: uncharacterized protein LOC100568832 [Acyrthosiphon pisum]